MHTVPVKQRGRSHSFEPPEEYVGYQLCDPLDQTIGTVKEIFVNGSGEPEYIRVRVGLFGLKYLLLPVQMVAVDGERRTLVMQ